MGGYPNSDKHAVELLKKVSCEQLSSAWLLAEPYGLIKISSEILLSFGANITKDFEVVGTFKTAESGGGYKEVREQPLLKTIHAIDVAMAECVAGRIRGQ
jgi:hypothetical protein